MTVDNPPGVTEDDELQLDAAVAKDNAITDLVLGSTDKKECSSKQD